MEKLLQLSPSQKEEKEKETNLEKATGHADSFYLAQSRSDKPNMTCNSFGLRIWVVKQ